MANNAVELLFSTIPAASRGTEIFIPPASRWAAPSKMYRYEVAFPIDSIVPSSTSETSKSNFGAIAIGVGVTVGVNVGVNVGVGVGLGVGVNVGVNVGVGVGIGVWVGSGLGVVVGSHV